MIVEQRTVYRCGFCRRYTKFQARFALAHEVHCQKNPNRTPFIGELTFAQQAGLWVSAPNAEPTWKPYEGPPAWWPGRPGMIYANDGWHDVEGYENRYPGDYADPREADVWPEIENKGKRKRLDAIKPFWKRAAMLGLELDDKRAEWVDDGVSVTF